MTSCDWYCVRTQPKHEQIAAVHLRRSVESVSVFSPRLRIRRATRRGPVWFVEALFPGYLFARFDFGAFYQAVRATPGVSTVVSFGEKTPQIPDGVIQRLRAEFDETECHVVEESLSQGEVVTIVGGAFHGLSAQVLRVLPAATRVQVLLEILGNWVPVEVSAGQVVPEDGRVKRMPKSKPSKPGLAGA